MRNAARPPGWKVLVAVSLILVFAGGFIMLSGVSRHPAELPVARHEPLVAGSAPATSTATPSPSATATPASPAATVTPAPVVTAPVVTPKAPAPAPSPPVVASGPSGVAMPTGDLPGWRKVFSDDFNGTALDTRAWGAYSGQPGGDPGGLWDPSHVVVHDGVLELQTYQDPAHGGRWVSGGLSMARALKQTYGKYLVRFRMDPGYGIAGIMLLWPSNDVWPPEIDFAEDGGGIRSETTATLHYGSTDSQIARSVKADFTMWHTIGIEWGPGHVDYTLDGAVWGSLTSPYIPSQLMEMDIQTQAGTCGQVATPCPDASTPSHVNMQVDWVVAYKPA